MGRIKCALTTGLLMASVWVARGEDGMQSRMHVGVTVTDGNSDTLLVNAGATSEGNLAEGIALLVGGDVNYGESRVAGQKETTLENARLFANIKRDFSERIFGALDSGLSYDRIADLDYRFLVGPALGVHLIRRERVNATMEVGPAYLWEKSDGERDDYMVLRIAERIRAQVSDTAHLWQSAEFIPKSNDFGTFLLQAEVGAEAAMTHKMNLRVVLRHQHDSTPADGLDRNDLTLLAGLSISL